MPKEGSVKLENDVKNMKSTKYTMKKLESDVKRFNKAIKPLEEEYCELAFALIEIRLRIYETERSGRKVPKEIEKGWASIDKELHKLKIPDETSVLDERLPCVFEIESRMLKRLEKEMRKKLDTVMHLRKEFRKYPKRIAEIEKKLGVLEE